MARKKVRRIQINDPNKNFLQLGVIRVRKSQMKTLFYYLIRLLYLVIIPLIIAITLLAITINHFTVP